ncbi:MAG: ABC transporter permease subunit [Planctomycetota bacterium]
MSARSGLANVGLVAGRDLASMFDVGIAYIYAIGFCLLANSIFMNEFFLTGTVDMTPFFALLPLLFAFFVPAISMRIWAEERKQRTIELLLTLPISPGQAVVAKFLASLAVVSLFLASSLPIPIMLGVLGDPDVGQVVSGYLGAFLFGALFLALGGLLSALSADQIVAFVGATLVGFLLVLSGDPRVVAVLDGLFANRALGSFLQDNLSVLPPYQAFVRGVLELSSLVYFLGLTAFFLFTTTLVVRHHRD